ncbi:MAG: GIY-YIG nuclease family protein [Bacteroidetes bacterium]|nr:GIY-YIG nuclease family protein [Bacteroidota bacterium]
MAFTVYALFSKSTRKFYRGQTDDFNLRLSRHNAGIVNSTKNGVPWVSIWTLNVDTRTEALALERRIKKRGISRYLNDIGFVVQIGV